ncbi:insulinase family protein [bacterium]|nr:insulinase family protein [bacterium]
MRSSNRLAKSFALALTSALTLSALMAAPLQLANSALAAPPATKSIFVSRDATLGIEEYKLPSNGLSILLCERHATPVVTVNVVFRVGSCNEAVGYTGSTHFLEHMMFKGTNIHDPLKQTGLDDVLKKVGGINNATTSYDRTNYYELVPKQAINLCLELEADRMRHLLLRESDRKAEMTVVRNELERGEDDPSQLLEMNTFATAFREHPYHHPVIGWRSDVEGVPTERLRQFYNDFYYPNNATLVVIGDFDKAATLKEIESKFGAIPKSPKPFPTVYTTEPPQEGERRFTVSRGKELARVMVAYHTPRGIDRATYPLDILQSVLGGDSRKSSRLYKRLIETGLASDCYAANYTLKDPGLFIISATVQPGIDPKMVEAAIQEEVNKLSEKQITAEELRLARSSISKRFRLSLSDPMGLAQSLTEGIAVGSWKWWASYPRDVQTATAEEALSSAKKFFLDKSKTVGYYLPTDFKTDAAAIAQIKPTKPTENLGESSSDIKDATATVEKVSTRNAGADLDKAKTWQERVERYCMPNGMTVLLARVAEGADRADLHESDKSSPKSPIRGTVAVSGKIRAGDFYSQIGKSAVPDVTAELLTYGTKKFSKEQISTQMEEMGVSLNFSNGTFFHEFESEVAAEDLPKLLSLIGSEMRQPKFQQSDLDLVLKLSQASIKEKMTDTGEVAWNSLVRSLYKPGCVYYAPELSKQMDELSSISLSDIENYHQKFYSPGNTVLAVIGDIDIAAVKKLLEAEFGDWKGEAAPAIKVDISGLIDRSGAKASKNRLTTELADKANVDIAIGKPVDVSLKSNDYLAAMIGNAVLGYDSFACRLAPVRDKLGLTYSISSHITEPHYPYSPWSIDLSVNPVNVDRSLEVVRKIVADFNKNGVTIKELETEQDHLAGVYLVGLRSIRSIAKKLTDYEQLSLPVSYMDTFGKRVKNVTLKEVNQAAGHYFRLDDAVTSVCGTLNSPSENQGKNANQSKPKQNRF